MISKPAEPLPGKAECQRLLLRAGQRGRVAVHLRGVHLPDAYRSSGGREEVRRRRLLRAAVSDRPGGRRGGRPRCGRRCGFSCRRGGGGEPAAGGDVLRHGRPASRRGGVDPAPAHGRGRRRLASEGPGRGRRPLGGAPAAGTRRPDGAGAAAEHGLGPQWRGDAAASCRDHHGPHRAPAGRCHRSGAGGGRRRPRHGPQVAADRGHGGRGRGRDVLAGDRGRAPRRDDRPAGGSRRPSARAGATGAGCSGVAADDQADGRAVDDSVRRHALGQP